MGERKLKEEKVENAENVQLGESVRVIQELFKDGDGKYQKYILSDGMWKEVGKVKNCHPEELVYIEDIGLRIEFPTSNGGIIMIYENLWSNFVLKIMCVL